MPQRFLLFTHNGIISGPLHLLLRLPAVYMTCGVPGILLIEVQLWGTLLQAAFFKNSTNASDNFLTPLGLSRFHYVKNTDTLSLQLCVTLDFLS